MENVIKYFSIALILMVIGVAQAAQLDGEDAQREIKRLNSPNLPPKPTPREVENLLPDATNQASVEVQAFQFIGAQLISEAELQLEVQEFIGKKLDFDGLNRVTRRISELYRSHGWLAKVYLPPQDIQNGLVTIEINEAKMGELRTNPTQGARLNPNRASRMLTRMQQKGQPLNSQALEKSMLLINDLPGYSANATLSAGALPGETDVTINLQDEPIFDARLWADNFGGRILGKLRYNGQVNFNNLTGEGDRIGVQAMTSKHVQYVAGNFEYPLGDAGTRFLVNGTVSNFKNDIKNLDIRSDGYSYQIGLEHPLIRSRYANLALQGYAEQIHFTHETLGFEISDRVYSTFSLALKGDRSDNFGLGGVFWAGLIAKAGNLDLSDNADDLAADRVSARSDGRFNKLNFFIGRQQVLGEKLSAKALLSAQFTDRNLGAFEKFSLGGPAGLSGFTVGEAAADRGWMLNLEGRYSVTPQFSASLLADAGGVCLNKVTWLGWDAGNPKLKNCYQLASAGFGLNYTNQIFDARLSYGRQITGNRGLDNNGKDADGESRKHQFWLQLTTNF